MTQLPLSPRPFCRSNLSVIPLCSSAHSIALCPPQITDWSIRGAASPAQLDPRLSRTTQWKGSRFSKSPSSPDLRRQDKIGARPQVAELNLQETNNSHSGSLREEEMNPDSSIPALHPNHHQKLLVLLTWLPAVGQVSWKGL